MKLTCKDKTRLLEVLRDFEHALVTIQASTMNRSDQRRACSEVRMITLDALGYFIEEGRHLDG